MRTLSIIRAVEDTIKIKKKTMIFVTYRQGLIFNRFEEKHSFITVIKDFRVTKSTMIFKINIVKLQDEYQKLKN